MSYSIRNRAFKQSQKFTTTPPEKKQKVAVETSQSIQNASSVVYVGNIPPDWNEQIIGSVVAGSGKIIDIRPRIDSSGRSKNFCFVEYLSPQEASHAITLLNEITLGPKRKLRIELSKEGLRTTASLERDILKLDRNFLPYYVNLPAEMRTDMSIEKTATTASLNQQSIPAFQQQQQQQQSIPAFQQQQQQQQQQQHQASAAASVQLNPEIPEILAKASAHLPAFNPNTFTSNDKISENLQTIPPLQLIELLATLKTLLNRNNFQSAQQVFQMSPNIPINVVQALILMGLVDINVLTAAISGTTLQPAINESTSQYNINPQIQQNPSYASPTAPNAQPDPRWPNLPAATGAKLAKLDQGTASMISQLLSLPMEQITLLPEEERRVALNIRSQYL